MENHKAKKNNGFESSAAILLVVDVQPKTLNDKNGRKIAEKIVEIINNFEWNKIYAVRWFSRQGSTFHLTRGTLLSEEDAGGTEQRIEQKLSLPTFAKQAPSSFSNKDLTAILEEEKANGRNIFVIGFDYGDCIISTVLDGHSRNLRIYAIDELCGEAGRIEPVDEDLISSARLLLKASKCLVFQKDICFEPVK